MPIPTTEEKLRMLKPEPPSEEELAAVAKLRLGDYEIGFQRTNDILDEGLQVQMRSSRSSMGAAGDAMVAVFTAQGDLVNAAAGTYLHAIIQPAIIKFILKNYGENPGIRDGDIWCTNDALYGGIHNPDVVVVMPVFHRGRLIAWASSAHHTTETGAIEPGGMPITATSRFHEGLNLPPAKIGEDRQLRNDWMELFLAYGIRAPQTIITDLRARATTADRVRTRILELADKEGVDFVIGLLRKMLMAAEQGARARLLSWPDGKFRCVTFSDALGTVHGLVRSCYLTMVKEGDRLTFDFTGTSPENESPYNAHITSVVGHVANHIYSYVFYDLPISSASFASIDFVVPKGTCLNPDIRAATSNSVMIATGIMSALPNTFAKMLFCTRHWRRVTASSANAGNGLILCGTSQWGLPYADMIAYSLNTEGMGGRCWTKGMDTYGFSWAPAGRAPDVELMENEFPLLVPISQHWKDSCGHGKHRGGVGSVQLWVVHQTPQLVFGAISDNSKLQTPQPLFGGYAPPTVPGISIRNADLVRRMQDGDPSLRLDVRKILEGNGAKLGGDWQIEFFGRETRPYREGDVATFAFSNGGAGYGDPLEAEPEDVVRDVENETVSEWSARNIYKVSFDPETGKLNREETERVRREEREARRRRGRPYREFVREWSGKKPPDDILTWYGSWPDAAPVRAAIRP